MDLIKEEDKDQYKVQIYLYNGKYILKVVKDGFEQTFKIGETDVFGVEDLEKMITPELIEHSLKRFESMKNDWELVLTENKIEH
ncbi:MAG: hypothetical protein M9916_12835 [Crocinitomicaceae bacterium]|nr:hypothetical protein [Crocinitomicaceae bacterium]